MYWLCVGIGIVLALGLALIRRRTTRFNVSIEDVLYTMLFCILGGFVGAKAFQIIGFTIRYGDVPGFWTLENWLSMIPGVGVFYGGLIGGFVAGLIYVRKFKVDFKQISDILIPSLLLAHAFGRIGCFFAGCCHGLAVDWRIAIFGFFPVQLFEAGFILLVLTAILVFRPEQKRSGIILPIYLIVYAIGRFILEFFRGDVGRGIFLFSTSQWISLLILPAGALLLWWTRKQSNLDTTAIADNVSEPACEQPLDVV